MRFSSRFVAPAATTERSSSSSTSNDGSPSGSSSPELNVREGSRDEHPSALDWPSSACTASASSAPINSMLLINAAAARNRKHALGGIRGFGGLRFAVAADDDVLLTNGKTGRACAMPGRTGMHQREL